MGLALWSYGIVMAQRCGQRKVVAQLATLFETKESNLRQRLREWTWERAAKRGRQRAAWEVSQSFEPLLRWVLSLWPKANHDLVLAMDATSMKDVLVVLSISVVYRACAIPVAWAILPEGQPGAWKAHWLALLASLQPAIPRDWQVLVMADRGLYARWLFQGIQAAGWHPFLRLNTRNLYCPKGQTDFRPMKQLLPAPGQVWAGAVTCFATHAVAGTLLASWGIQYHEPWLILTDLTPQQGRALWYGLRSWIEAGFKDLKSDGWQWHKTRMTQPDRAARFWLALAVATLWVVSIGGEVDAHLPVGHLEALPPNHIARRSKLPVPQPRLLSCFSRGLLEILARLVKRYPIRPRALFPEPWPQKTYP